MQKNVINKIYIDGEFVTPHGTELADLFNPATGQVIGQVQYADEVELHEALLAASHRLILATAIINIWVDPPARVAASYQRVERSHPGRILIGLGSSHAGLTQGQEYRPYQKMVSYLDELDALSPTVPTDRRVLAALGPKMLRLAAERSAGVHPYLVTPAHTKKARDILGPEPLLAPGQQTRSACACSISVTYAWCDVPCSLLHSAERGTVIESTDSLVLPVAP